MGSHNHVAKNVVTFALKDGTTGIIAPEARRTYDHIIRHLVGDIPLRGLTDEQVALILQGSRLPKHDLEDIWQSTETIDAPPSPDGLWTQLETYFVLHCCQTSERLSLNQMATQYVGSLPPDTTSQIRRRSSYAQAGLALRPPSEHDPMPISPISPAMPFRNSTSYLPATVGAERPFDNGTTPIHVVSHQDDASISQPGLEAMQSSHAAVFRHYGHSQSLRYSVSQRTDATEDARRLANLIESSCPKMQREADIERVRPALSKSGLGDRQLARDILVRIRREAPKPKDPSKRVGMLLKSKKAKQKAADSESWDFHPHEKSQALLEVIKSTSNVGTATALIEMGADMKNFHSLKTKIIGSHDETTAINYTRIATDNNSPDMVSFCLASGVSQSDLFEALRQAVELNYVHVVQLLLQYGVDPNSNNGCIFESAVTSQNLVLVRMLLRSRTKVRKEILTRLLPVAVEREQTEIASLLVLYGADTQFESSAALRKAVHMQRIDLVLAIMKGIGGSMRSNIASSVFVEAFQPNSSLTVPEQRLLMEILLCAGAKGNSVSQVLLPVVRARRWSIAELLIKHGVDLNYNDGEALRYVVATDNLDILSKLLVGKVSEEVVSSLIGDIPSTSDDNQVLQILSLLLNKGAKGPSLDQALHCAVQRKNTAVISLLLDHCAKIDVDDSQPLRTAITNGDLATLDLLLSKGRPRPEALPNLLPLIPQNSAQLRYDLTKSILNSAVPGSIPTTVLNDALVRALRSPLQDVDLHLIPLVDLFIETGASVDCRHGDCFRKAAELESMKLMELLIQNMVDPTSLLPAFPVFMKMTDRNQRRVFIITLLKHCAKGSQIDQALVDSIEENVQDERLIAALLQKADVEYHKGEVLSIAVRAPSVKLVATILDSGRTSRQSRARAAQTLFLPGISDRISKANVLLRAGIGQNGINNALIQEIDGERNREVVKIILNNGGSCTFDNGKSLALAIKHQDNSNLEQLVAQCSDRNLLACMVSKSSSIKNPDIRYSCLDVLTQGGAAGEQLSHAMLEEIEEPDRRDRRIIQLLVTRGAAIDYSDGRAIRFVVASLSDVHILKTLLQGTPSAEILGSLVPLTMAHRQEKRLSLLRILLEKGATGKEVDAALVTAVAEGSKAQPTVELLLDSNASVDYNEAAALKIAARNQLSAILELLLHKNPKSQLREEALSLAMQVPPSASQNKLLKRLNTVRLLTKPNTIGYEAVDSSLTQAVQESDHSLIEHLLNSEADPNSEAGASVVAATQRLDVRSLHLLSRAKFKLSPQTCSRAFSVLLESRQKNPEMAKEFDRILIPGGANGIAVDQSFVNAMRSPHTFAKEFVALVLEYRTALDVNFENGRSLCIAVRRAQFESVEFLLTRFPSQQTLQTAFMAVFESGADEEILIRLVFVFLRHSGERKDIYFRREKGDITTDVLYQALHRHGDKPKLLQTLLDNGCSTTSTFNWTFDEHIGNEDASELLWLLCQETSKLDSRIIGILLEHGADPNFRTSKSGNTPLIRATYLNQPDILVRLLEAGALIDMQDKMERTVLQHAVLAGNLAGIQVLLDREAEINDESLHIAARMLKLPVVLLLLRRGASTSLRGTVSCEGRTPLAELCRNADLRENPPQLRKTIKCLSAAMKDLRACTADGKSLIFHALDNNCPQKLATALLASCSSLEDELNNLNNIYSRGSRRYSPTAYVRHFKCVESFGYRCLDFSQRCCNLDACPAPELEQLLRSYHCQDRFWDDQAGIHQPKGVSKPPQAITTAIMEAEARRLESERLARANAEEKARKERAAAELKRQREQMERERDAAADAERRRADVAVAAEMQRNRQRADEETRAIDRKAAAEQRAIEARTHAELEEKHLLAQAEAREDEARRRREREQHNEEIAKEAERDQRQTRVLRERANIQIDQKKMESNIDKARIKEEKALVGEKKRLMDSGTKMFKEAAYSGISQRTMGRVIGEIEDGR